MLDHDVCSACRKEQLWPHLREFADRGIVHAKSTLVKLAEDRTPCELYTVHGHYADAGEVAFLMTSTLGVDMALTGHSLGRNKLEHLLSSGELLLRCMKLHVHWCAFRTAFAYSCVPDSIALRPAFIC